MVNGMYDTVPPPPIFDMPIDPGPVKPPAQEKYHPPPTPLNPPSPGTGGSGAVAGSSGLLLIGVAVAAFLLLRKK